MKVLFLNTSNNNLVIGIVNSDKLIYEEHIEDIKEHSKYVLLSIEKGLEVCDLVPFDIDRIIVIDGPGSFTGLRIGITITKTYGFALKKKVLGVSSLKAIALSSNNFNYVASIVDAKGGYIFGAIYDKDYNIIMEEKCLTFEELENEISKLYGNVVISYNEEFLGEKILKKYNHKKVKLNILKIVNYYKNDNSVNFHKLNPKYLKKSQAEENLV
ncbi:MAG: tRNA (adenosine(37)-N6)-threonylcarbamoyltransferase complex dimerization subunit type 1 TsaB [Bacilli bacterium]